MTAETRATGAVLCRPVRIAVVLLAAAIAVAAPLPVAGSAALDGTVASPAALDGTVASPTALDGTVVSPNATACTLAAATDSSAESRLLARVNRERQAAGLAAVRLDRTFVGPIARWRSQDMIERRFFSHHVPPPDGPLFSDWLDRAGINYSLAGETIGWSTHADQVAAENAIMDGFLASPGHRAILLGPEYADVAIGVAGSCTGPFSLASDVGSVGPVDRVEIVTLIFVAKRGPNAPFVAATATASTPAVLRVTVTPDGPGTLKVLVVDESGRTVRWLTRGRPVAGRAAVAWNGLDAKGRRVHGTFQVHAWTVDAQGRKSPIRSVTVRV